jgi:restriction system protein
MNPTLVAIRQLGGSGSNKEIADEVIKQQRIPDNVAQKLQKNGPMTELEYRLAWTRTCLKIFGIVDNSQRGIWSITDKGYQQESVNPDEVQDFVLAHRKRRRIVNSGKENEAGNADLEDSELQDGLSWKEELLGLLRNMDPSAFERLCQRLLRESGFIEVQVTGRSGDGGIDGRGIIRFAGLIGFPVLFQCKRYEGSVTPSQIRDFHGAMTGRADRGLFITTGRFTQEAQREATRDGAPPIDLINGEMLVEKLKELKIGVTVTTRQIEEVEVNTEWFATV